MAHFLNLLQKNIMSKNNAGLKLLSFAFSHKGHIPARYTCEGENINPAMEFENIPDSAQTLALIMEDPDAAGGTFDHWLLWNISPNEVIAEGSVPGVSGTNSFGKTGYGGPCLPSGVHRYFFKLFALDCKLDLPAGAGKQSLLDAMEGHIVGSSELMGLYQKQKVAATK
jgi:Raf kinase inhibitor-like YbhB/YbcL family protein